MIILLPTPDQIAISAIEGMIHVVDSQSTGGICAYPNSLFSMPNLGCRIEIQIMAVTTTEATLGE